MMGTVFRVLSREARGARGLLLFFVLCLSVGIGAIVGVRSLVSAVNGTLTDQSRALMAADLDVSARRPIPPEALQG